MGGAMERPAGARAVVLIADDFALSGGVTDAIGALATAGRLTGTGAMMIGADLRRAARVAEGFADRAELGLHVTLTDHRPLGRQARLAPNDRMPAINRLLLAAFAARLPSNEIAAEIGYQLDRFETTFGRQPDFIDGHQHCHVLPGVTEAVLALFETGRLDRRRTWMRSVREPFARIRQRGVAVGKAAFLSFLSRRLDRLAKRAGIATNVGFGGVYDFSVDPPFVDRFARFLTDLGPCPLIMVHPGHVDDELRALDPVTDQRAREFSTLSGREFDAALANAGVVVAGRGHVLGFRGAL